MKSIPIYIYDTAIKEKIQALMDENESLGFDKNKIPSTKVKFILVDFFFNEEQFIGYWVDLDINDDSGTIDIVIYIGGSSFRTPYSEERQRFLNQLLSQTHY
jgi:hypothetical protein